MNHTSIPRLRSVQLKSGGAKLSVFRNPAVGETKIGFQRAVEQIKEMRADDMVGYAIVAWGVDGGTSSCSRVSDGRWVGRSELPDFVKNELQSLLADSAG